MSKLNAFVLELAKDSNLLEKYRKDPSVAAHAAGLSESDIAALLSKDPTKISAALKASAPGVIGTAADTTVVVVVV